MELSFATARLRREAMDRSSADTAYGEDVAAEFHARLADLSAAVTVSDLAFLDIWQAGHSRLIAPISTDRMIVCVPVPASDPVDWSRVHRLKVLGIEGKG
jgi:hypothetical protein